MFLTRALQIQSIALLAYGLVLFLIPERESTHNRHR